MSKKSKIARPNRDPDHMSKRSVPYWWSPEWIRGTSADYVCDELAPVLRGGFHQNNNGQWVQPCVGYGRIHAVKEKGDVNLYMKSKDGNLSFIQGSIQKEFKRWHEDRSIDYLLLGIDPDEIIANEDE